MRRLFNQKCLFTKHGVVVCCDWIGDEHIDQVHINHETIDVKNKRNDVLVYDLSILMEFLKVNVLKKSLFLNINKNV
jgi:hypothetical protein